MMIVIMIVDCWELIMIVIVNDWLMSVGDWLIITNDCWWLLINVDECKVHILGRQLQRLRDSSKRLFKLLYNYKRLFQLLNCRSKINTIYTLQIIQYQCFAKISREIMNLKNSFCFFIKQHLRTPRHLTWICYHNLACVAWRFWLGALYTVIKAGEGRENVWRLFFSRLRRSVVLPTKPPCYAG